MTNTPKKPKVLISDKMDPNAARIFEERGCDVDVITGESPEELKRGSANITVSRSALRRQ